MPLTDKEILEKIEKGQDDQALSAIYQGALPGIRKFILSNSGNADDVKDIFQDAMVVFYRQVKTGKFNESGNINGFLFTVARNLFINSVKRSNRMVKGEIQEEDYEADDLFQDLISREKETVIEKLFSKLGETCSEILKLALFNNFSMKEIAEKVGFSNEKVAKTKSYKCRKRLSEMIKDNSELLEYFKN